VVFVSAGISEFWYTAFKNCELFNEFIRVRRGGEVRLGWG